MIPIIRPARVSVPPIKKPVKTLPVENPTKTKTIFITRPRTNQMPIILK